MSDSEYSGTFLVNNKAWPWKRNPLCGGWYIDLVTDTIQLVGAPSQEAAAVALSAYQQGFRHGETAGRAQLQNEFRNLMDCQPR